MSKVGQLRCLYEDKTLHIQKPTFDAHETTTTEPTKDANKKMSDIKMKVENETPSPLKSAYKIENL